MNNNKDNETLISRLGDKVPANRYTFVELDKQRVEVLNTIDNNVESQELEDEEKEDMEL